MDKGTLEFEAALLAKLLKFAEISNKKNTDIKTYINVARSFDDLSNAGIESDVPRIIGGVMIVYAYVLLMLGGFDCVQQKPFLGGIGLFCVFLAIISSYGICSLMGLVFSPMHNIIPFLIMGKTKTKIRFIIVQNKLACRAKFSDNFDE